MVRDYSLVRRIVVVALSVFASACGGGSNPFERFTPTTPTAVAAQPSPVPPPAPPPSTTQTPTIDSLIGVYKKHGELESWNCPKVPWGESFDATLTIERSAEGNRGVRFIQTHPDGTMLPYSQFDVSIDQGSLVMSSGEPIRDIGELSARTHIQIRADRDGTISGSEKLVFLISGCDVTYRLTFQKQ